MMSYIIYVTIDTHMYIHTYSYRQMKAALKKTAKPSNTNKTKCKANNTKGQFHAKHKRKRATTTTATATTGTAKKAAVKGSSAGAFVQDVSGSTHANGGGGSSSNKPTYTNGGTTNNNANNGAGDSDNGMDIDDIDDIILSAKAKKQKRDNE
jgi:hypothetical protein